MSAGEGRGVGGVNRPLRIDVLTLFPDMFEPVLAESITGRARKAGLVQWNITDIRSSSREKHHKVDDRPFGGGPGMVMMCQPLFDAVTNVEAQDDRQAKRILLSPQGEPITQPIVEELSRRPRLLLIAGRYEGVDERVIERLSLRELSVGDFVVSGGELPAIMLIDAVIRLLPGALGHEEAASQDSFSLHDEDGNPLLDCPHYTRPRVWEGEETPETLLSGDHARIERWRHEQRVKRTRERRPDMLRSSETTNDSTGNVESQGEE